MTQKIFGIGWSKTGTTSMEQALITLGYNVCRGGWKNPTTNLAIAFALNKDYSRLQRIIQKYDAFFDAPFGGGHLWKHLAQNFPESSFILTVREPEAWYRSLCGMLEKCSSDQNENHMQNFFENGRMAIIYFLEHALGVTNIHDNKQKVMDVYNKYNAQVINSFAGRDNLLVLNIEHDTSWGPLCDFLDAQVPNLSFPHLNKAKPAG